MASLRSKVIRLAHSKPELRSALLPLLKVAVGGNNEAKAFLKSLASITEARLERQGVRSRDVKTEFFGDDAVSISFPRVEKFGVGLHSNNKVVMTFRFDWGTKTFTLSLKDKVANWFSHKDMPLRDMFFEKTSPTDAAIVALKLYSDYSLKF